MFLKCFFPYSFPPLHLILSFQSFLKFLFSHSFSIPSIRIKSIPYTTHPELIPESIQKKKTAAMMARRDRGRGSGHNHQYQFEGMPLTYTRPAAPQGATKRLARAASTITKKIAQRKVQFNTGDDAPTGAHERYPAETEESEKAHLPQPFLHGLPTSSLEPGTTNLH